MERVPLSNDFDEPAVLLLRFVDIDADDAGKIFFAHAC